MSNPKVEELRRKLENADDSEDILWVALEALQLLEEGVGVEYRYETYSDWLLEDLRKEGPPKTFNALNGFNAAREIKEED